MSAFLRSLLQLGRGKAPNLTKQEPNRRQRWLSAERLEHRELMAADLDSALSLVSGYGYIDPVAVVHDMAGATYLTGVLGSPNSAYPAGVVDFDPSNSYADNRDLLSAPLSASFVAKYDASGAFVWLTANPQSFDAQSGNVNATLDVTQMVIGTSGSLYVTGSYTGSPSFGGVSIPQLGWDGDVDRFVGRLDPSSGSAVWMKELDLGSVENTRGLAVDESRGRVYLAGDVMVTNPGQREGVVVAIDQANVGQIKVAWTASLVSSGVSWPSSTASDVVVDASGAVYIVGSFTGKTDFDPSGKSLSISSGNGGRFATPTGSYLWKLNSSGSLAWARVIQGVSNGNAVLTEVEVDASQNILVAGSFSGDVDFDPGKGTVRLPYNGRDVFVASFSSSGAFQYANSLFSAGDQYLQDMRRTSSGAIFLTGLQTTSSSSGAFVVSINTNRQWTSHVVLVGAVSAPRISIQPGTGRLHVVGSYSGALDVNSDGYVDLNDTDSERNLFWLTFNL